MNDPDSLLVSIERSARSVARWSTVTKVIVGVMLFIALIMLLYAFSRADRHTDDFVGFGIMSIGIAALALVFGSNAAFHAAFGDIMRLAAATHLRLELLARAQEQQASRMAVVAPPPRAEAPPPGPPAEPAAEGARGPAQGASAATAEPPAQKSPPEPAMKKCPACRTEIRAEALRCRNCYERV